MQSYTCQPHSQGLLDFQNGWRENLPTSRHFEIVEEKVEDCPLHAAGAPGI